MKNLPNILSGVRMILAPVFLFMYIQDELIWRSLSIAIFAGAAVTDYFDGKIARRYQLESDFGVFLDPLADKFLTFAGFFCLPFIDSSQFPWWAVIIIIVRDVVITALRLFASRKKYSMKTRTTAKAKTLVQMIFLYIALLIGVFIQADIELAEYTMQLLNTDIMYYLMVFVAGLTLYSGIEYLWVNREIFKSEVQAL